MKLYYFPGACSMASHIIVNELQLPVDLVRVDLADRTIEDGRSFLDVNPEGYVPALELDDGSVLTESAAILQYLCDSAGTNTVLPQTGSIQRYRVIEMLSYIATEVHQSIKPLVISSADVNAKKAALSKINARLGRIERVLNRSVFLTGSNFTIADAYAFAILSALRHFQVPLGEFPQINAYLERVSGRATVIAMLKSEGLMK